MQFNLITQSIFENLNDNSVSNILKKCRRDRRETLINEKFFAKYKALNCIQNVLYVINATCWNKLIKTRWNKLIKKKEKKRKKKEKNKQIANNITLNINKKINSKSLNMKKSQQNQQNQQKNQNNWNKY